MSRKKQRPLIANLPREHPVGVPERGRVVLPLPQANLEAADLLRAALLPKKERPDVKT